MTEVGGNRDRDPRSPQQHERPGGSGGARRWAGLFFIALGVAMIIADVTIVNVAVPQIIRRLGVTSSDAQWVQDIYTLVFAALLLTFGRLGDRHGRRRVFDLGALVFVASSALAARAGSGPELIGARALQGAGGAMMLPTSLSLINAGFRGKERGIAFAVWGATIGGTAALGPLLGGWLTTAYSWRWAFTVNIPLGLAVLAGTLLLVPESRGADEAPGGNGQPAGRAQGGTDWPGAACSALALAALVFGLIEGRSYGWWSALDPISVAGISWHLALSPVPFAFAAACVLIAAFATTERRRRRAGRPVMLDLDLFGIPSFRNGNLTAGIVSLGEFGLLFALPLWFQNVRGYSAFQTGLALLPLALGSFAASGLGATVGQRRGPVLVVRLGIALELAGVAAVGLVVSPHTAWWAISPALFVYGAGVGLATAQLTGVVLADVPVAASGQASGTQSTTRQVGAALGVAVLGTVLFSTLGSGLRQRLAADPALPAAQRGPLVAAVKESAGAAIGGLSSRPGMAEAATAARAAFSDATRWTAFTAAGFLLLGLVVSRRLGSADRADRAEQAEQDA